MKKRGLWITIISVLMAAVIMTSLAGCVKETPPAPTPPTLTPTSAPTLAPVSFAGKTITIIVPSSAGGGIDIMSRIYARYLTKYLPGNPTIVVRDIPGGGGTLGVNTFYASKPDGLTVIVLGGPNAIAYILGVSAVKYDLLKTTAVVAHTGSTLYVIWSGIVDKAEDLLKAKGLMFGYSTAFSLPGWNFAIAKELLNLPVEKVIMAYGGSGESRRAFLSKEINMTAASSVVYGSEMAPYIERGEVMPLFQLGILDKEGKIVKDPAFPPAPTVGELYEKIYGKACFWQV